MRGTLVLDKSIPRLDKSRLLLHFNRYITSLESIKKKATQAMPKCVRHIHQRALQEASSLIQCQPQDQEVVALFQRIFVC